MIPIAGPQQLRGKTSEKECSSLTINRNYDGDVRF